MVVLPIKAVREEDGPTIGLSLLQLGNLHQAGFPVPDGIIVTPPELNLKTVLEHFNLKNGEVFDQHLTLVRSEIAKISPPEELVADFTKRHLDSHKLWQHLLEYWLMEVRSRIWREGFSPNLTKNLSSQPVFFMNKITAAGRAYFDYERNFLMVELEYGTLTPAQNEQLEKLVKDGNKKLMLPQIYDWNIEKDLKIVKISPFTAHPVKETAFTPVSQPDKKTNKSTVKIFLNLTDNPRLDPDLDGVILSSEQLPDFDQKLLQLIESSENLPGGTVILKLFDKKDRFGKIRGTQYLIHEKKILQKDAEAMHFLKNKQSFSASKKYLTNLSLAIPFVRSSQELKEIKQDLLALKVSRSSSMKFWLELAVPENLLNIEKYLEVGIDGILLNCDELASWVGGFDPDEPDSVYYKSEIEACGKLIEQTLPKIQKEKLPVIAMGALALHDDVLDLLVAKGIWGLCIDQANLANIHDRVRLIERRLLNKAK